MFKKSVGQRALISRHTHIVIAALAVSGMLMIYAIPAQQQLASATAAANLVDPVIIVEQGDIAQEIVDDTRQRIEQDAEQDQRQDQDQRINQDIAQTNEAEVDQEETNNQANVIDTGDNTATTTQIGDNDAIGNALSAESEGGSAEAKGGKHSHPTATGGSSEAEASIEQEVDNTATTTQDSSADDNVQVNTNTFGDDVAWVDQDNRAIQAAANLGFQNQEQDLNQYATNTDVTANVAEQTNELCDPDAIGLLVALEAVGPIC